VFALGDESGVYPSDPCQHEKLVRDVRQGIVRRGALSLGLKNAAPTPDMGSTDRHGKPFARLPRPSDADRFLGWPNDGVADLLTFPGSPNLSPRP